MLQITYAEDDPKTAALIREYLGKYNEEHGPITVTSYTNGAELVQKYIPCDILMLDVDMPGMNGMDAAREIRKTDQDVAIVFLTNLPEFAIQGYEVNAFDFVLKPISYYALSLRLDRAVERLQSRATGRIILHLPGGMKMLSTDEIYYLETNNKTLSYHTASGVYSLRGTLQQAEKELAPYHFARCNQCYLVNLNHVTDTGANTVTVHGEELVVSKRNKAAFLEALVAHVGGLQ